MTSIEHLIPTHLRVTGTLTLDDEDKECVRLYLIALLDADPKLKPVAAADQALMQIAQDLLGPHAFTTEEIEPL